MPVFILRVGKQRCSEGLPLAMELSADHFVLVGSGSDSGNGS